MTLGWPSRLWIVRHGQSAGNVARDRAHAEGLGRIDIAERDVDVPLSALGEKQAEALGRWFEGLQEPERPDVILTSPYLRARRTGEIVQQMGGAAVDAVMATDERLREREFGVLDRLTYRGIDEFFPDQAKARARMGKFYFRPPGGESWCDVILRLHSAIHTISLHYSGARLLIVSHQVVVLCLRYLLENMSEAEILAIDAQGDVANCAITEYAVDPAAATAGMRLVRYNFIAPLEHAETPVTSAPDAKVAAR